MQEELVRTTMKTAIERATIQHAMREALLRDDLSQVLECAYRLCGVDKDAVRVGYRREQKVISIFRCIPEKASTI
jgi:hypothetical protein